MSTLNWEEESGQVVRDKAEKTCRELQYSRHKIMVTSTINGNKHGGNGNGEKKLDDFDGRTERTSERLGGK